MIIAGIVALSTAQLGTPVLRPLIGMRSLALSPDGSQLAFTYRGDVWVVSSAGGRATPVTNNVEMDDNAIWSPDGKWIAFASNRNGGNDIYIVPADGGESRRLTWHSGADVPSSWSPDGRAILIRTTRDDSHNGIYSIDVKTGQTRQVFLDMMNIGSPEMSPDGKEVLYQRMSGFPWNRPRYEGSGAAQLWTYDLSTAKRTRVRSTGQQHLWPHYSGDGKSIYCVTVTDKTPSSHRIDEEPPVFTDSVERTPNVYRVDMSGRAQRLTHFVGHSGARFLTVNAGKIAFEKSGEVYSLSQAGEPSKVPITAILDDKSMTEERLTLATGADDASLSPKGDKMAFSVRGEIWVVPTKKGKGPNADDAAQLTDYPGSDDQPLWDPDGKSLFFVSDRNGAHQIHSLDPETKKATLFVRADADQTNLFLSPDRKALVFSMAGPRGGIYQVPLAGGEPKLLLAKPVPSSSSVSPDGRFLAYTKTLLNSGFNPWENATNIWVRDLTSGQDHAITALSTTHSSPEWSADGKYLYFRTGRDGGSIYMFPLTEEAARTTELELKYEKPAGAVKVEIDFNDPERRLRRMVSSPDGGGPLVSDPNTGDLYYLNSGEIWKVSYTGEGAQALTRSATPAPAAEPAPTTPPRGPRGPGAGAGTSAIRSFELSEDKNQLVFIRDGGLNTLNLRGQGTPTTPVTFRADWTRDVRAERDAAFTQFWRIYNRTFYDPAMHRRDWASIAKENRPLLDGVAHRNEMATVLNMMVGELESSHSEVSPGPGNPNGPSTAHLGFTIDYSHTGPGLKIREVPARTPGSFAKTLLKVGDYVMTINGTDVRPDEAMWKVLADQSGREVTLTVNSSPSKSGAREVKYRALSGGEWSGLLYRNRIEARRKYVEEKSGGKLTYLHIAGMGSGNLDTFNLEAWQYVQGKQGVVIDVRNNGGGNIADILLDILERKPQMRYFPRDAEEVNSPGTSWNRPTVVMHAETSFSNAEMFPAAMKARGLASLVGMPTPGYVIYTNGTRLVDGTSIRLPGTGVYRVDGTPTENLGQEPDFRWTLRPRNTLPAKILNLTRRSRSS